MILRCPVCRGRSLEDVFSVVRAPVHRLIKRGHIPTDVDFCPLDLVRCATCGHLFNRTYESVIGEIQYHDVPLSNIPVHTSMVDGLRQIAELIGRSTFAGKRVVEIGAGTGHLARMIAREASEVVLFEPCGSLVRGMVPEANISLFNEPFEPRRLAWPADLIVCRQVIEHVADPHGMIADIAGSLAADGFAYLEVPSGDYIVEHGAVCDIHLAHVQYFTAANFRALMAQCGLETVASFAIKDGHDMGFLVRAAHSTTRHDDALPGGDEAFPALLSRRISAGRHRLSALSGPIALYGATPTAQAFLGLFDQEHEFRLAFDDNREYGDYALYGPNQVVPVATPDAATIRDMASIVITSYLHQVVISEKLRAMDFRGAILSIKPGTFIDSQRGLEGLFG